MDTRGYENPFASSEEEIGQMDVALKKVIWERKYFKADMKIQGPLIDDEKLYYLVSLNFCYL